MLTTDDAGMVLVHGNGPQVGMILLRMKLPKTESRQRLYTSWSQRPKGASATYWKGH